MFGFIKRLFTRVDNFREDLEDIFAKVLDAESGIVRNQFISGSHAINVALQALLRPNETLLAITGTPYDTLHEVIGIKPNNSSLMSYNVKYKEIDLINNDMFEGIEYTYKNIPRALNPRNNKSLYACCDNVHIISKFNIICIRIALIAKQTSKPSGFLFTVFF